MRQNKGWSKAWNKLWNADYNYSVLSRKEKLKILGRKWSKGKIRKELKKLKVYIQPYPHTSWCPDLFCPECGCKETRSTGNMAPYPELYEYVYCLRCGYAVAYADNSPTIFFFEEDPEVWRKTGITFIEQPDIQDDCEFKQEFLV